MRGESSVRILQQICNNDDDDDDVTGCATPKTEESGNRFIYCIQNSNFFHEKRAPFYHKATGKEFMMLSIDWFPALTQHKERILISVWFKFICIGLTEQWFPNSGVTSRIYDAE